MSSRSSDDLYGDYTLACSHPGCAGKSIQQQAISSGLRPGDLVPEDPSDPSFARCPLCKRHQMKVLTIPSPATQRAPNGFSKIPVE